MAVIKWRKVRRNQDVDVDLIQTLFDNDKSVSDLVVGVSATTSDHASLLATLDGRVAQVVADVAPLVPAVSAAAADAAAAKASATSAVTTATAAQEAATQAVTTAGQANTTATAANNTAVAAQAAVATAQADAASALAAATTAQAAANAASTTATAANNTATTAAAQAADAASDAASALGTVAALQSTVGTLQSGVNNHETRIVNLESGGTGGGGAPSVVLTNTPPPDAKVQVAAAGASVEAARADHAHNVAVAAPVAVGTANAAGSSASLSRADHVHSHGNQAGGALHAVAVSGGAAGFMSGTDKAKLDGIASGAEVNAAANANTVGVGVWRDKSGGTLRFRGVKAADAKITVVDSAADSTIAIGLGTVAPSDVGAAPASHDHSVAQPNGLAGYMTGADKAKLDGIAVGATATQLATAAPPTVSAAAGAAGSSGNAARQDHTHAVSTGTPVQVGKNNLAGVASTLARSDHVHAHGDQDGGKLHASVIPSVNGIGGLSGFMEPADKERLDALWSAPAPPKILRAYYEWDGAGGWELMNVDDPLGVFPGAATNPSVGQMDLKFDAALPLQYYAVAVANGPATPGGGICFFSYYSAKTASTLRLHFFGDAFAGKNPESVVITITVAE